MAEHRHLQFFLLRYVPDAVKGEFVNIGLVMVEPGTNGSGFADVRFTKDWRRVRCLDPQADVEMLVAIEREIREQLAGDRSTLLRRLEDSLSNVIQLSGTKGCLAVDPVREMEAMSSMYLESPHVNVPRELSGRHKILQNMRETFEQAGVAKFLNPLPVERYTGAGDLFTFDFGYRVGNEVKLFHAVSLKATVNAAVTLAARYPKIADAMRNARRDALVPYLTAVIDDDLDTKKEEIGFALGMMRESEIRVSEVKEMPRIVEVARQELHV